MKRLYVVLMILFSLMFISSAFAGILKVLGCFENSCSITPTDTWETCVHPLQKECSAYYTDVKPILKIIGDPNCNPDKNYPTTFLGSPSYEYTFLGRTGDKTFEIKALIYGKAGITSNNIMKLYFEKNAIIPLGEGYKLQMLGLKGNTLTYRLIKP